MFWNLLRSAGFKRNLLISVQSCQVLIQRSAEPVKEKCIKSTAYFWVVECWTKKGVLKMHFGIGGTHFRSWKRNGPSWLTDRQTDRRLTDRLTVSDRLTDAPTDRPTTLSEFVASRPGLPCPLLSYPLFDNVLSCPVPSCLVLTLSCPVLHSHVHCSTNECPVLSRLVLSWECPVLLCPV